MNVLCAQRRKIKQHSTFLQYGVAGGPLEVGLSIAYFTVKSFDVE
jgi:hypothetical protein